MLLLYPSHPFYYQRVTLSSLLYLILFISRNSWFINVLIIISFTNLGVRWCFPLACFVCFVLASCHVSPLLSNAKITMNVLLLFKDMIIILSNGYSFYGVLFNANWYASCSVIVEALKVDSLQKLCSSLEPILRRVVRISLVFLPFFCMNW